MYNSRTRTLQSDFNTRTKAMITAEKFILKKMLLVTGSKKGKSWLNGMSKMFYG